MVYSGWEIFDKLNKFPATTQSLDAAEVASHKLKVIHEELGQSLKTCQSDLNSFWKGNGATNAAAGLAPPSDPHPIDGKHVAAGSGGGTRAAGFGGGPSTYTPHPVLGVTRHQHRRSATLSRIHCTDGAVDHAHGAQSA
jgi:hypothetical protein